MKGFIARAISLACVTGGLCSAGGCYEYNDFVDPCYPQRYEHMARQEVRDTFAPQVQNGHVLDQTVWNYHFEAGSAVLTSDGQDHLKYLARRRPCPDPNVFLQVAQDISYDPAHPDKYTEDRDKLDALRIEAVQKFLTSYTAGRNVAFNVTVHDPAEVGISGVSARGSIILFNAGAQGILTAPPRISAIR